MIEYKVCTDCIMAIVNNDFSGLDYFYTEEESRRRLGEITQGMKALGPNIVCMDNEPDAFCTLSCDCCGTRSIGERHYVADISDDLNR